MYSFIGGYEECTPQEKEDRIQETGSKREKNKML